MGDALDEMESLLASVRLGVSTDLVLEERKEAARVCRRKLTLMLRQMESSRDFRWSALAARARQELADLDALIGKRRPVSNTKARTANMRRYRQRLRQGVMSLNVDVTPDHVAALIGAGLLTSEEAEDRKSVAEALDLYLERNLCAPRNAEAA